MRNVGFLKMRGSPSDMGFSYGNWSKAILVLQRITKPLLYQLSYVGVERAKIASHDCGGKDKIDN
jgi:hypothetical protein